MSEFWCCRFSSYFKVWIHYILCKVLTLFITDCIYGMTLWVILGNLLRTLLKSLLETQASSGGTCYPSTTCRNLVPRGKNHVPNFVSLFYASQVYSLLGARKLGIDFHFVFPVIYSLSTWTPRPVNFEDLFFWPGFSGMCQPILNGGFQPSYGSGS